MCFGGGGFSRDIIYQEGWGLSPGSAYPAIRQQVLIFPRHSHLLAHQMRRVSPRPWMKLLWTAVKYFGRIQVSLLIDRKLVHAPHLSRQRPKGAPLIQHLAAQIILQDLKCAIPVTHPQVSVFREKQSIDAP